MGVTTRGDVADALSILEDGFVIADVDVIGVDDHRHQLDGGLRITLGERGCFTDEVLVPVYKNIHARLRSGEVRAEIKRPHTPVLFQAQAHQRA